MPLPGREIPGTLVTASHPKGPLRVGVTVVSKITAICPKRIHELAEAEKFPYLVNENGVRRYDLVRVLEILMDGDIPCKPLLVGFADDEVDMAWAYDAIMGGLGRVGRRAPSARAVTWVLNAGKSDVLKKSIVEWGDRRLVCNLTAKRMATHVKAARTRKRESKAVDKVSEEAPPAGPSAADRWMADNAAQESQ